MKLKCFRVSFDRKVMLSVYVLARKQNCSVNSVVRRIIRRFLDKVLRQSKNRFVSDLPHIGRTHEFRGRGDKVSFTTYLHVKELRLLRKVADELDCTVTEVIREAVTKARRG